MKAKGDCSVDLIAQGDGCAVGRCRHCGNLHLHVAGRITLRITGEMLLDLVDTLSAAAQWLDARQEEQAALADPGRFRH